MADLDAWIAGLGAGHPLLLASLAAALLGLRHAADPDHVFAVTTLVAGERDRRARLAARLGLAWGAGHATTLFAFGVPVVVFASHLPERAVHAAEALIGLVIIVLALRLLVRWRRGLLHAHEHSHGHLRHSHLHGHGAAARHEHRGRPVRSACGAYTIGLVHGLGGSAGVGVLLLAGIESSALAMLALLLFALFTAVSMSLCSGAFGLGLGVPSLQRSFLRIAPGLACAGMAFGAWYALGAVGAAPYPL